MALPLPPSFPPSLPSLRLRPAFCGACRLTGTGAFQGIKAGGRLHSSATWQPKPESPALIPPPPGRAQLLISCTGVSFLWQDVTDGLGWLIEPLSWPNHDLVQLVILIASVSRCKRPLPWLMQMALHNSCRWWFGGAHDTTSGALCTVRFKCRILEQRHLRLVPGSGMSPLLCSSSYLTAHAW